MRTSVKWMNDYLEPPASADEQADALTACGFPFEGREELNNGDISQEIEMSSNRGDCVCHLGMAREIAALTSRRLRVPEHTRPNASKGACLITVCNDERELCPLYTARVIRGVTVKPSPDWLQDRLRAIGQTPRNNLVDATNFVLFEMGQPTHVFDLAKLDGDRIHIRRARAKEPFAPIGEDAESVALDTDTLVIADDNAVIAIAGVKGGATTAVTESTTDILLEAATFDALSVRNTSRRLGIASDSSYRFERGVHPAQVSPAADRLAALILDIAGGAFDGSVAADGAPIPAAATVSMRPDRCRTLLGVDIDTPTMLDQLALLGLDPQLDGEEIKCTIPAWRGDLSSEVDLIEEVGRIWGYENLAIRDTINVALAQPQSEPSAREAIRCELVSCGFLETISHTLVSEQHAAMFLGTGRVALRVSAERGGGEPTLRPSLLPSLLSIARRNRDRSGAHVRAFEIASVFDSADPKAPHRERLMLGIVIDGTSDTDAQLSFRQLRGVVARLAKLLLGNSDGIETEPDDCQGATWLSPCARLTSAGATLGKIGVLDGAIAKAFDCDGPVVACEFELEAITANYPPLPAPQALPAFPPIDRDLSVIVDETVSWQQLESVARSAGGELLDQTDLVTVWRDKSLGNSRKSVSMRLRFRSTTSTLRHEEVDPNVAAITAALADTLNGEVRT